MTKSPAGGRRSLLDRLGLSKTGGSSDEDERARERRRRIVLTAATSMLAKIVSVSTALISVPLTLHYLGTERYGMWMTMSSFISLLSFADLGIGNGLLSAVASANGRDDRTAIRAHVSSAYVVLGSIAVVIACVFAAVYVHVDWYRIFNVTTPTARAEAGPALAVLIGCIVVALPLGVVQRVQMGLQSGFLAGLWQCFASLAGLAAVLVVIRYQAPLPYLVLAFAGAPQLANGLNSLVYFLWLRRDVGPRLRSASLADARSIASTGVLFLVLQIVAAVSYSSDSIIIAQILGASAVAEYSVPEKLFSLIGTVLTMMLAPLWPAYGEALARGDRAWVDRMFRRSLMMSIAVATACSLPLVVFGPWIIGLWVGHAVSPPLILMIGLGIWKVVESAGTPVAVYMNGVGAMRLQAALASATAVVSIVLKITLTYIGGVSGPIWATIISFLTITAIPIFFIFKKRGIWTTSSAASPRKEGQ